MNSATGADKVNRIAAVVTEIVAEHGRMSEHMMSIQSGMMQMMQGDRPLRREPTPKADQARPEDHEQHNP
jgi:hypothetical protein